MKFICMELFKIRIYGVLLNIRVSSIAICTGTLTYRSAYTPDYIVHVRYRLDTIWLTETINNTNSNKCMHSGIIGYLFQLKNLKLWPETYTRQKSRHAGRLWAEPAAAAAAITKTTTERNFCFWYKILDAFKELIESGRIRRPFCRNPNTVLRWWLYDS